MMPKETKLTDERIAEIEAAAIAVYADSGSHYFDYGWTAVERAVFDHKGGYVALPDGADGFDNHDRIFTHIANMDPVTTVALVRHVRRLEARLATTTKGGTK